MRLACWLRCLAATMFEFCLSCCETEKVRDGEDVVASTRDVCATRSDSRMSSATFRIWRGNASGGEFRDYTTGISEGMVVLDAVNHIQATQANDLACRWKCKAGKCGSCSAEVNGMPKLMCMTRMREWPLDRQITVEPMN